MGCADRLCGDDGAGGRCPMGCARGAVCVVARNECIPARGWVKRPLLAPPPGAWRHAMVYDEGRGVIVLFGIRSAEPGETWEFDSTAWRQVETPVSPPGRIGEAMAYDAARHVVVLFGGSTSTEDLADTWEYDGATWTEVTPAVSPPARDYHALAYDAARRSVVLFGGGSGAADRVLFNDTWVYDGTTWNEVRPPTAPSPRSGHGMVYDSAPGRILLFGGRNERTDFADTWLFDGSTWSQLPTPTAPRGRHGHGMAYDSAREVVVVFSAGEWGYDDTWELDGTTWTQADPAVSPPGEGQHLMAYDSARRVVVMLGGSNVDGYWAADTWEYDGATWTKTVPQVAPAARAGSAIVYDSSRGVSVLYGGSTGAFLDGTWEYDGNRWIGIPLETTPGARVCPAMAYDSSRGVTVLNGGNNYTTWEYDGATWIERRPGWMGDEPRRERHAMAYDSARRVVVLYGGYPTGGSVDADTWEYRSGSWSSVNPRVSPPDRTEHAMVYDSIRGVVVLFGGYRGYPDSTTRGDTWEYDGTTWTEVGTPVSPPPRCRHAMAFDAGRGVTVLFGGARTGEGRPDDLLDDTWEYDGVAWNEIQSRETPPARQSPTMTFDSGREVVVLFGGSGTTSTLGDTWEYLGP